MKTIKMSLLALFVVLGGTLFFYFNSNHTPNNAFDASTPSVNVNDGSVVAPIVRKSDSFDPMKGQAVKPMPTFLKQSMNWLAKAQARNGGFGSGQHSTQQIRDPRQVNVDPATTAFVGLALMRVGNTLQDGQHNANLRKALEYMLKIVEHAPENNANITKQTGTQPQQKLGQNIDVSLAAQFLIRVSPLAADEDELQIRIDEAIAKCLRKLESTQLADGSWNDRGWARVLSSAMANNALEMAEENNISIDKNVLALSRSYQQKNVDAQSGKASTDKSAGVDLYAYSSTQRATAMNAKKVQAIMDASDIKETKSSDFSKTKRALADNGYNQKEADDILFAYQVNRAATENLKSDKVLSGFGNNGGEEYLSYMMTSEALVMSQDAKSWNKWHSKMKENLGSIVNSDGSWSGHHCITSPVFCTAAVVMTLTADRDGEMMRKTNF